MPNYTISIKAAVAQKVVDAFASEFNYQSTIKNADGTTTPNSETAVEFTKRKIGQFIEGVVNTYQEKKDVETARTSAAKVVSGDITIS